MVPYLHRGHGLDIGTRDFGSLISIGRVLPLIPLCFSPCWSVAIQIPFSERKFRLDESFGSPVLKFSTSLDIFPPCSWQHQSRTGRTEVTKKSTGHIRSSHSQCPSLPSTTTHVANATKWCRCFFNHFSMCAADRSGLCYLQFGYKQHSGGGTQLHAVASDCRGQVWLSEAPRSTCGRSRAKPSSPLTFAS